MKSSSQYIHCVHHLSTAARHRAGLKLEAALEHFGVDVTGLVALDSGLSTGGFTDCLLQRGAIRVYGVDVGFGQVATPTSSASTCSIVPSLESTVWE